MHQRQQPQLPPFVDLSKPNAKTGPLSAAAAVQLESFDGEASSSSSSLSSSSSSGLLLTCKRLRRIQTVITGGGEEHEEDSPEASSGGHFLSRDVFIPSGAFSVGGARLAGALKLLMQLQEAGCFGLVVGRPGNGCSLFLSAVFAVPAAGGADAVSSFLSITRGTGILSSTFDHYGLAKSGHLGRRRNGVSEKTYS